ncbi:Uncharacterised protein [Vibrio cholerae]|nr:Uncharacterised protein [Vibrio cholerae]CSI31770.1 Uncharacterised protein [Vibrio cholerae]
MEELLKLLTRLGVKQNRFRPTFARTQYVAVREATTSHQTLVSIEHGLPSQNVAHMHINRIKTSAVKRCRHLNV